MSKIVFNPKSLLAALFLFQLFSFCSCQTLRVAPLYQWQEEMRRDSIVQEARIHLGTPYRYAGKKPGGFDCSGFTAYIYDRQGISLGASARTQAKQGKPVKTNQAKPGDLVFFGSGGNINHVGIVVQNKNGKLDIIHSTNSQGVVEDDVYQILYWKKRLKFVRDVISP